MHIWVYEFMYKICLGKQLWRFFLNHTRAVKKPENNRFHVPIHFATDRFTFGKIPPPPPLLHPRIPPPPPLLYTLGPLGPMETEPIGWDATIPPPPPLLDSRTYWVGRDVIE